MHSRTFSWIRSLSVAAALGFLALPATTTPNSTGNTACRFGPGGGTWMSPAGVGTPGFLDGRLGPQTGATQLYRFEAMLIETPSPCLSCLEGEIRGTLDDGNGPGPDYIVTGRFRGAFLSGEGTFEARILAPTGATTSGWVRGIYRDPIGDNLPGGFRARWTICP